MKKLLGLVLVVLLTAVAARGADVQFAYGDFSQTKQALRPLLVYPIVVSATNAAGITTRDRISRNTGLDGTVTISNMMPGWVRADFHGLWMTSTNWFVIPDTNGLVMASDCLQTNYTYGGGLPGPAPWWGKGELGPGLNIAFATNAGRVLINGSAAAGTYAGMVRGGFATLPANTFTVTVTCTNESYPSGFTGPYAIAITPINLHVVRNFAAYYVSPSTFIVYCSSYSSDIDFSWIAIQGSTNNPHFSWP